MVLALRTDVDGEGDIGFDLLVPCPAVDVDCDAPAWLPVYSVTDLLLTHTCDSGYYPDAVCPVHGQDDPEGRADLEAQYADTARP